MGTIEIRQNVSRFIIENLLLGQHVDVERAPSFLEAGIVDSTGILELVQFLEETFGFTVDDTEMLPQNLDSLAAIESFVERKRRSAADPPATATPTAATAATTKATKATTTAAA